MPAKARGLFSTYEPARRMVCSARSAACSWNSRACSAVRAAAPRTSRSARWARSAIVSTVSCAFAANRSVVLSLRSLSLWPLVVMRRSFILLVGAFADFMPLTPFAAAHAVARHRSAATPPHTCATVMPIVRLGRLVEPAAPIVDFALRCVAVLAVELLQTAYELLALAFDAIPVAIAQLAPLLLGLTLQLLPLTADDVPVHGVFSFPWMVVAF